MGANDLAAGGLAVASVVLWLVWIAATRVALRRRSDPHRAGPATMDLGPQRPAVVNYLLHRLHSTSDAIAATLLDLAAGGHLEVIQLSPDRHLVVPRNRPRVGLAPYEVQLLDVVHNAVGDHAEATVPAIAAALDQHSNRAWMRFALQVRAEARRTGLVGTPDWGRSVRWLLVIMILPFAAIALVQPELVLVGVVPVLVLMIGGIFAVAAGNGEVLTPKGADAATAWLGVRQFIDDAGGLEDLPAGAVAVWDRYLAYGAAMGLSKTAVHTLADEVRSTLTLADVRTGVAELRGMRKAMRTPDTYRQWRATHWPDLIGEDVGPDQIYGSDTGDFWELLTRTGTNWHLASTVRRGDPALWREASEARLAILEQRAPADLRADVAILAASGRGVMDHLDTRIDPAGLAAGGSSSSRREREDEARLAAISADPIVTGPVVRAAAERVAGAVGAHLGCGSTLDEVQDALFLGHLDLRVLLH